MNQKQLDQTLHGSCNYTNQWSEVIENKDKIKEEYYSTESVLARGDKYRENGNEALQLLHELRSGCTD